MIAYEDAAAAIDWLRAFGFASAARTVTDETIVHAELELATRS